MTLILYSTPGDFLRDNGPFIDKYEVSTQLNQGNALAHQDELCGPGLLFGRCEQDRQAVLLFGNTLPGNLCLNAPSTGEFPIRAVRELAAYLNDNHIEIAGVNGREAFCQEFIQAHGGRFRQRSAMDILVLEKLIEPPRAAGTVRKAVMDDLDLIVDWKCAFYHEALHEEPDPNKLRQNARDQLERSVVWLMENEAGEPVSMAHTTRRLAHGVSVSGVYTPPGHRGHGYCQNTVAAICREKLAEGCQYCTLFVDKKNPISNRVYRKIGFEVLEDASDYKIISE